MGLRHYLTERYPHALEADRVPTVQLVAERAAIGLAATSGTGRLGDILVVHASASSMAFAFLRRSSATLAASSRLRSPTSRPSDVVIGERARTCSIMNLAISAMGTKGRK